MPNSEFARLTGKASQKYAPGEHERRRSARLVARYLLSIPLVTSFGAITLDMGHVSVPMALLLLFDAPALHSWQIIAWLVGWAGCILSFLWPLLRSAVARFLLHAGTVASLGSFYFWVWSDTTTSSAVPFLAAMVINLVWLLTAGLRLVPRGIDPADGTVKKQ